MKALTTLLQTFKKAFDGWTISLYHLESVVIDLRIKFLFNVSMVN